MMEKCPSCKSTDTERSKNDSGFFRSPSTKPVRMYMWRCLKCGFVGTYTETGGDAK
jgi:C4-type Zn-finger protein